jgi:hypothetical protein
VTRTTTLLAAIAVCLATGCDELADFRTGDDEVFHGEVIGSEGSSGTSSFILQGFHAETQMELTFDPSEAALAGTSEDGAADIGTVRTYVCPSEETRCKGDDRESGHFDAAPLEPIASLAHDALSRYDFPGGGRLRNYMFGLRFDAADREGERSRHAMIFLSLMDNERVEARVIAPSVLDTDGETEIEPALFGVFVLSLRDR